MTTTAIDLTLTAPADLLTLLAAVERFTATVPDPAIREVLAHATAAVEAEACRRLEAAPAMAIWIAWPLAAIDTGALLALGRATERCADGAPETAALWRPLSLAVACELHRRGHPVFAAMSAADHRALSEEHELEHLAGLPDPRPDGDQNIS